MYSAGYNTHSDQEDYEEEDEEDGEDDDEESEDDDTAPPDQRQRGNVQREWEKKTLHVDERGTPCGALVGTFETDLRCLSMDLDPGQNWAKQQPAACERFMKRLWSGTTILFVPKTKKPYFRMQRMDVYAEFVLLPIT